LEEDHLGTLTIDIAPDLLVKKGLIDLAQIAADVDHVVLMAYDYHYIGSTVSGPVSPLLGAGTISEYDTQVAITMTQNIIMSKKIILGFTSLWL
jgi:spore germination protein YaaH